MAGKPNDRWKRKQTLEFDETTFGGTLGGAIIEDELFFFASYEYYDATSPVEWGPSDANAVNGANAKFSRCCSSSTNSSRGLWS